MPCWNTSEPSSDCTRAVYPSLNGRVRESFRHNKGSRCVRTYGLSKMLRNLNEVSNREDPVAVDIHAQVPKVSLFKSV